ncbi:tail fiber domain-containing protein [Aureibacter tunicatorum]|uniref:Peptidase S74 domain-containing protein n=1 Tax=Aureibacter tunicatorum TaxID=866807 RepID=A0AAE3XSQ1_9BACT|nr:tail fiber domain-containing protein [Aureibacter tunicatorum]MDR6241882.1 hypothetical protein [Aureibacter tunicatorum]BDD07489.1 hypothetical protein AUTU_49720 [Aureibacter tunicatorum]
MKYFNFEKIGGETAYPFSIEDLKFLKSSMTDLELSYLDGIIQARYLAQNGDLEGDSQISSIILNKNMVALWDEGNAQFILCRISNWAFIKDNISGDQTDFQWKIVSSGINESPFDIEKTILKNDNNNVVNENIKPYKERFARLDPMPEGGLDADAYEYQKVFLSDVLFSEINTDVSINGSLTVSNEAVFDKGVSIKGDIIVKNENDEKVLSTSEDGISISVDLTSDIAKFKTINVEESTNLEGVVKFHDNEIVVRQDSKSYIKPDVVDSNELYVSNVNNSSKVRSEGDSIIIEDSRGTKTEIDHYFVKTGQIESTGSIIAGTTLTVNEKLTVNETSEFTGKMTVNNDIVAKDVLVNSDQRLKENVETLQSSLEKVEKMRGVNYQRISDKSQHIGFIAQEVEEVIPNLVETGVDGIKSVRYAQMTAVLVEAIKEISAELKELKESLNK